MEIIEKIKTEIKTSYKKFLDLHFNTAKKDEKTGVLSFLEIGRISAFYRVLEILDDKYSVFEEREKIYNEALCEWEEQNTKKDSEKSPDA